MQWRTVRSGKQSTSLGVSLRVGPVRKDLVVHGDRKYYKNMGGQITTTSPEPFIAKPIRYERSEGGPNRSAPDRTSHAFDAWNPVGVGFATDKRDLVDTPAPNVEHTRPSDPKNVARAGFGSIDWSWSPRRELAGTYDASWERTRKPLLPDDYNELYASSAPADQRVSERLHGGEPVELVNLTPQGLTRFELPRIYLTFTTMFGNRAKEHRARMSSVQLDGVNLRIALVWQSALMVAPLEGDYLDYTVIRQKPYLT